MGNKFSERSLLHEFGFMLLKLTGPRPRSVRELFVAALLLAITASGCGLTGRSGTAREPDLEKIVSNKSFLSLARLKASKVQTCMRKNGFSEFRSLDPTAVSKSAGARSNFTLGDRRDIGFGVLTLLDPPPPHPSSLAGEEQALAGCSKEANDQLQLATESMVRTTNRYLEARQELEGKPLFLTAKRSYAKCMASNGFPRYTSSEAAFRAVLKIYKEGANQQKVRDFEIPVAVADYRCILLSEKLVANDLKAMRTAVVNASAKDLEIIYKELGVT